MMRKESAKSKRRRSDEDGGGILAGWGEVADTTTALPVKRFVH
jgi:hypothetical protein